jgi:hypothetical protein
MAKNDKFDTDEIEDAKAKADAEDFAELEAEEAAMAKAAQTISAGESLVKMRKDGETLEVHPSTVKDHIDAGWELV